MWVASLVESNCFKCVLKSWKMPLNRNLNVPTTWQLFECLKNWRDWNLKSPLQKWLHLYGIGRALCNVIKMTPYNEDQTLSWFAYYPLFYMFIHLMLVIYTIVYYVSNGEFHKFLPCTCLFVGPVCGVLNIYKCNS